MRRCTGVADGVLVSFVMSNIEWASALVPPTPFLWIEPRDSEPTDG